MIQIDFSPSFERSFRKNIRQNRISENIFWQKVEIFIENPFEPSLKTHKLSGRLKEYWSFSLGYDLRIIFYFVDKENAIFVDIGTHDEVY